MQPPEPGHLFKSFPSNLTGRDFVVGDIHGHFELLQQLLGSVRFDASCDRLFSTGDLVDRGPFSEQAVQWLAQPWFHAVRGNHEQMIIDYMNGQGDPARHARNGGAWFYNQSKAQQQLTFEKLSLLPLAIEVALSDGVRIGIIHAESPGWEDGTDWNTALSLLLSKEKIALNHALYSRLKINGLDKRCVQGIDRLFVGHSTVQEILNLGNVVYLDTGCSFPDGMLTAVELSNRQTLPSFSVRP